jgi:hypothetical protein
MILPIALKGEANKYSIPYRCAAKATDYWLVVCSNLHLNFTLGSIHYFPKKKKKSFLTQNVDMQV